ncbi:helicase subunit [Escherichia coli]|nr:helicase subunit [Escherichia coli]EDL1508983.1 helicase subunit [Salmonella enterica subsp. enterica serovar Typhimurium]EFO3053279.1 helicase subunit [Escherichia coli O32]MBQ5206200.1 helicase subunit [Klebsiella pneumoniae]EAB7360331.1 helicase subunit [Escherichia coli]
MKKVTNKHNVLQEEVGGMGKFMIYRCLREVMN